VVLVQAECATAVVIAHMQGWGGGAGDCVSRANGGFGAVHKKRQVLIGWMFCLNTLYDVAGLVGGTGVGVLLPTLTAAAAMGVPGWSYTFMHHDAAHPMIF
jgi:hypothetical protein